MAGMWTQSMLRHFKHDAGEKCPWCGGPPETLRHLWWECPRHEEARRQAWGGDPPDHRALPDVLAECGLPL
eukprot:4991412-Alexandrium_andersonii.AAC.1